MTDRTANKAYYRSRKRCTLCGKQDAYTLNDRSLCAECAEKRRILAANYRNEHPERIKAYRAEYEKGRRAAGLCHACGKPTENGRSRCPRCREKENRRRREKVREDGLVNLPRGDNGVCWQCNKKPALDGQRLCQSCRDLCAAQALKLPRDRSGHFWKELNYATFAQARANP